MKFKHISAIFASAAAAALLAGCDKDGKELIIIEDDLPIKTETLYMVGDATPCGWSIDNPEALTPSEEDALVFVWEGLLYSGEMKLCLVPGSWDAPFIRPMNNQDPIGKTEIKDAQFQMHAGDPDEKWRVTDTGIYNLSFNLRNWTMSSKYIGELVPDKTPIETTTMYLIGSATEAGWSWDAAPEMTVSPDNKYIFTWEGVLNQGELKACAVRDSDFGGDNYVRPAAANCEISSAGVASDEFVYTLSPDDKWLVTEAGIYKITFDLQNYTIEVQYKEALPEVDPTLPIETETLYIIGDATDRGWTAKDAIPLTVSADNKYVFAWEGALEEGELKAYTVQEFASKAVRPLENGCEISSAGVASNGIEYTGEPDDKWKVTEGGIYKLTFDLQNYTIAAEYKGAYDGGKIALAATGVYIVGDATPWGWSFDAAEKFTVSPDNKYVFSWEGNLTADKTFKAYVSRDFGCKAFHPSEANVTVSSAGVAKNDFVYAKDPDDQWKVTESGKYRITFDLENWTISAAFLSE